MAFEKNMIKEDAVNNSIIMYETEDGTTKIDVKMENETVWLSLDQMSTLFGRDKSTISKHIKNIFEEGELERNSVVAKYATTALDGKTYQVDNYNLDVIISVGYRVKSLRGTQFRIWATKRLKEYMIKGFTMNDDLLKQAGGGIYWKELLERIRDIRSSEKVFYRQILDLYATSVDYNGNAPESKHFFQVVQNKFHYAVHGHTAPEIISQRADAQKPFMGLNTFEGTKPKKNETHIAKNYLDEDELAKLNRMVVAFFELAELQALNQKPMYMKDWTKEVDDFAERYGKGALENAGTVSSKDALEKADQEYKKYQEKTVPDLSKVEKDYLETIKTIESKLKEKK